MLRRLAYLAVAALAIAGVHAGPLASPANAAPIVFVGNCGGSEVEGGPNLVGVNVPDGQDVPGDVIDTIPGGPPPGPAERCV